jgi:hypothetical protein
VIVREALSILQVNRLLLLLRNIALLFRNQSGLIDSPKSLFRVEKGGSSRIWFGYLLRIRNRWI